MPDVQTGSILTIGEGAINPELRIAKGEFDEALVEDMVKRLAGDEFVAQVDTEAIPCACVDGRGDQLAGPNAAGGTFSLVIGDALTLQSMRQPGETAPAHARTFFKALRALGKRIGGHDDEKRGEVNCGCGADDKLDATDPAAPSILGYITRRSEDIRDMVEALGITVDNDLHRTIARNAAQLHQEGYATNGAELRQVTIDEGGKDSVVTLPGSHAEAALVINTQPGQTLDRAKLHAAFGGVIDAFNLDVWALQNGCNLLAANEQEAQARFIGALYYNVATATVLADKLRIVVR